MQLADIEQRVVPHLMAEKMRGLAGGAAGQQRDYYLWLAAEWELTAERFPLPRAPDAPLRRTALLA